MTGRRAPVGRDEAASALGDYLPALGMRDAATLIDRIAMLLEGGETPGSVMARTNGPARPPDFAGVPEMLVEPAPSRSTVAAFGRRATLAGEYICDQKVHASIPCSRCQRVADAPPAEPKPKREKTWRLETVDGVEVRIDQCRGCGHEFTMPRRTKPGRYHERCTACRPEATR